MHPLKDNATERQYFCDSSPYEMKEMCFSTDSISPASFLHLITDLNDNRLAKDAT
jgi:hypothetical protein